MKLLRIELENNKIESSGLSVISFSPNIFPQEYLLTISINTGGYYEKQLPNPAFCKP
jgi:hypothetical protein